MTASTLKPQLRHALLSKLNSKRSGKQNALQKGFTLVELMIVIVIVGILSAVALPNFLSQTVKAKATECTTKLGAILSQGGAEALADPSNTLALVTSLVSTENANSSKCTFTAPTALTGTSSEILTVTVVGKGTDLANKYAASGCINSLTMKKDIQYKTQPSGSTPPTVTSSCS